MRHSLRCLLIVGSCAVPVVADESAERTSATAAERAAFEKQVRPFLAQHCVRCHGPKKQLADVRLDTLAPDVAGVGAETWHDVLGRLNTGEMPPEDEPQPTEAERTAVVNWLTEGFARALAEKRSTGGRVVMRRLTRYEYRNTMRDLLGIDLDFARDLPPESVSPDGFRNNGRTLALSPLQIELLLAAARNGLRKAIVTGPRPEVARARVEKSEQQRRTKGKVSNRLQGSARFLLKVDDFPREGRFRVGVRAKAEIPDGARPPRLRITVGVRADVLAPRRTLGVVEVDATGEPVDIAFTGRIEEFPLPGHNPKFPGLLVTATCEDDVRPPAKGNKNAEDPSRPVIVVESMEFEGPLYDAWPPAAHERILFPSKTENETDYAREVVTRFAGRAFRRPVTADEIAEYVDFFSEIRPDSPSFEEAIRETLAMVLVSPDFLYLVEPATDEASRTLTDHELAARLSYFLWSTLPDDELRKLADEGRLHEPSTLARQTRRMLADPRTNEFVTRFTDQWLDLAGVDRVAVNPEFFPDFDDDLKADMREEPRRFFGELLARNLSAMQLIDSDFAMLNRPLAEHYGIEGPSGRQFERVTLDPADHRGGLLTQAAVLLLNSNGERSHPIRRAVWLRTRLLDDPPAPPPPDVPELDEDDPETAGRSLREQLALHRNKSVCTACHRGIDPWGVAFENFDALGRWQTEYAPPPRKRRKGRPAKTEPVAIDASATLPGGHEIEGITGLKEHLLTIDRERVARAVVRKLLAYSLGRSLERTDDPAVDELVREFAANDHRLADLVIAIVASRPFRTK